MDKYITGVLRRAPSLVKLWRVVRDEESSDWGYKSRTLQIGLGQAPAVYGYSPEPVEKPNDYHVNESAWRQAYYDLNDYNTQGVRDGQGEDRCVNFLFKDDTALYNGQGFPRRELLTMSNNYLEEIEWLIHKGSRYLKFRTLRPTDNVSGLTYKTHPALVHRFEIVFYRKLEKKTVTAPKINRDGYLYYYLVSAAGFAYVPERFVAGPV